MSSSSFRLYNYRVKDLKVAGNHIFLSVSYLGKGYYPQPPASADNLYLDLDYSWYHKKSHPIIVYNLPLIKKQAVSEPDGKFLQTIDSPLRLPVGRSGLLWRASGCWRTRRNRSCTHYCQGIFKQLNYGNPIVVWMRGAWFSSTSLPGSSLYVGKSSSLPLLFSLSR